MGAHLQQVEPVVSRESQRNQCQRLSAGPQHNSIVANQSTARDVSEMKIVYLTLLCLPVITGQKSAGESVGDGESSADWPTLVTRPKFKIFVRFIQFDFLFSRDFQRKSTLSFDLNCHLSGSGSLVRACQSFSTRPGRMSTGSGGFCGRR